MAYRKKFDPQQYRLRVKPTQQAEEDYLKSNANPALPKHRPLLKRFGLALVGSPDSPERREDAAQRLVDHVCGQMGIPSVEVRVMESRSPHTTDRNGFLRSRKGGDYAHADGGGVRIVLWNLTPMRGSRISGKTFLRTLCHELTHHIDVVGLGIETSPHTAGFYARTNELSDILAGRIEDARKAAENAPVGAGTVAAGQSR